LEQDLEVENVGVLFKMQRICTELHVQRSAWHCGFTPLVDQGNMQLKTLTSKHMSAFFSQKLPSWLLIGFSVSQNTMKALIM